MAVHVHVPRSRPVPGLQRAWHNLLRLPGRTKTSVARWLDPAYQLERRAHREVARRLSAERREVLASVPGMSSNHECSLLCYLAATAPGGGVIVEIGAWKGKSAAWLTEGSSLRQDPLPIVSIDPHQFGSWPEFCQTVERLDLARRGLSVDRRGSHEAGQEWTRPISLLWIDGDHDYEPVLQDIDDFVPHVLPGGYVLFDDATTGACPGVARAIDERMMSNPHYRHAGAIRHLQLFQRRA